MNKKNLLNKSCITCDNFCWWDGDYCCIAGMQSDKDGAKSFILQESKTGEFTLEFIDVIEKHKDCIYYKNIPRNRNIYKKPFEEFLNKL